MHAQLLHAIPYRHYQEKPYDEKAGRGGNIFEDVSTEFDWSTRTNCCLDFACGFAFTDLGDRKPVQMRHTAHVNRKLAKTENWNLPNTYPSMTRFAETLIVRTHFAVTFDMPEDGLLLLTFHALLDDKSFIEVAGSAGIYVYYQDPAIQAETEDEVPIGATLFAARRKLIDDALRTE